MLLIGGWNARGRMVEFVYTRYDVTGVHARWRRLLDPHQQHVITICTRPGGVTSGEPVNVGVQPGRRWCDTYDS